MKKTAPRKQKRAINKKPAFLEAFRRCASLTEAAAAVGMDRGQHYDWLDTDAKYVAAFHAAKIEATQTLYDAAVERSLRGVFMPNVYQGRFCFPQEEYEREPAVPAGDWKDENPTPAKPAVMGVRDVPGAPPLGTWTRSESLHLALLRANLPAFRQNGAIEISGPAGGPIPLEQKRLATLTDDELSALIATAQKLATAGSDGSGAETPSAK